MNYTHRYGSLVDLSVRAGVTERLSLRIKSGIELSDATFTLDTVTTTGTIKSRLSGMIDGNVITFILPESFCKMNAGLRYRVRVNNQSQGVIDVMTGLILTEI